MTTGLLLTVPQVARELSISRAQAYRLVGRGEIPSVRIGRNRRVRRDQLVAWVEQLGEEQLG